MPELEKTLWLVCIYCMLRAHVAVVYFYSISVSSPCHAWGGFKNQLASFLARTPLVACSCLTSHLTFPGAPGKEHRQPCDGTKFSFCSLGVCSPPWYNSSRQQLEKNPKCMWSLHEEVFLNDVRKGVVVCLNGGWNLCTSFGSPITWYTSSCGLRPSLTQHISPWFFLFIKIES